MLGKLLKYEIQRSAKKFLPLVCGYFIVSILIAVLLKTKDFTDVDFGFIPGLLIFLYVGLTIALFVMGFFISVSNFNKTLFTDEGYLMLTIPVKEHSHIFTKLISSVIWSVVSFSAFVISLFIIDTDSIESFSKLADEFFKAFQEYPLSVFLVLVLSLVSFAAGQLFFYFLVSASNLFRRKVLGGLLIFVGCYIIFSITGDLFNDVMRSNFQYSDSSSVNIAILCFIGYSLLYCIIFFILTNYVVSKKFNLQ